MDQAPNASHDGEAERIEEARIDQLIGEELTDEQLLQMAEGSCSWGANCNKGC